MRMNRLVAVLVSFLLVLLGLGGAPALAAAGEVDPVVATDVVATGAPATDGAASPDPLVSSEPEPVDTAQPTEPVVTGAPETTEPTTPEPTDAPEPTVDPTAPQTSEPATVEPTESAAPEPTATAPTAPEPTKSAEPTELPVPADPGRTQTDTPPALTTEAEPLALLAEAAAGTISGTVTEAGTAAPAPNASVTLNRGIQYTPGGPITYSYYQQKSTTSTGTYEFTGIPDGSYTIKVTPPYGSPLAEYWVGGPTEAQATELVMAGGVGLAAQDVALPLGARLSGTVRGGSPLAAIPSANIEVRREWGSSWSTVKTGYTDSSGAFSVAGLPAGEYRIWVSAPYGTSWMSSWAGGATFDAATRYSVALGGSKEDIDVVLFAGATIEGTVTGGGAGLSMANVTAVRLDGTTPVDVASRSTLSDGSYSLGGLPAGTYRIRVTAPYQSQWVTTWLGGTLTVDGATAVVVAAGSTVSDQDVAMLLGASISGTITSAAGPVVGAQVYAYVPNQWGGYTSVGSSATSGASGAFAVRGLPAGTYRLMVTPPSGSPLLSAWIGGGDFASATQYPVALGESAVGANVTLTEGGVVSGTVVGDGVGIANAWVSAYRVGANGMQEWLDSATTNFDGDFSFSKRMPPGEIRLYASLNTYTYGQSPYLTTWYDGKQTFADATPVEVVAGQTTSVEFPLIKGASVSGQVLAGDPALPAQDATVEVCRDGFWNCRSVTTDDEGRYSAIGLEAGKYLVRALPPTGSNLLTAYYGGTDQNSATAITLPWARPLRTSP